MNEQHVLAPATALSFNYRFSCVLRFSFASFALMLLISLLSAFIGVHRRLTGF